MAKRRVDTLTGGTGDVSPQILTASITLTAANTFTEGTIALPQNRFQTRPDKAVVIEVLKIYWYMPDFDANPAAGGTILLARAQIGTASNTTIQFGNPKNLFAVEKSLQGAFTAAGTYGSFFSEPLVVDYTDNAGHGVLVAVDLAYFSATTAGMATAGVFPVKILYRFKEVTLSEYIGIVQSQS